MKIVVLDGHTVNPGDVSWDGFKKMGAFVSHDHTPAELIVPRIGDAEAAITNETPVSRETLAACPNLQYVGLMATGYDDIDVIAAAERGVVVTNVPDYSAPSVAQHAIALLLEACNHAGGYADAIRAGRWTGSDATDYWGFPLVELCGKTMGIVGFGKIGRATAVIAAAMGMKILAYARRPDTSLATDSVRYAGLDELFALSDVVSLHIPLFDSTRGMINAATIAKMKKGVIIVNTARGPLVEEKDMARALEDGSVAAYASDVVSVEPILPDNPLLTAKNCILTPHIAWASQEARMRLMDTAVANLAAFMKGAPVNVVS